MENKTMSKEEADYSVEDMGKFVKANKEETDIGYCRIAISQAIDCIGRYKYFSIADVWNWINDNCRWEVKEKQIEDYFKENCRLIKGELWDKKGGRNSSQS